jgi:nitroreductase
MIDSMEFQDVVRRRRMVRKFADTPVDPASIDRLLSNAQRSPSAGFIQGWAFLVLDTPADIARFWQASTPDPDSEPDSWLQGMQTAPVILVPLSNKSAYLGRYAEPDKGWTDEEESRWPVPYWHIDTGMASLLMLLTAVDEGLGACFFGIPPTNTDSFKTAFDVPVEYTPIGAIAVGNRPEDLGSTGSAKRGRKPVEEVVHRGTW